MRIRVFAHDANPAADRHMFTLSAARATDAIESGQLLYIDEKCARMRPKADETFDERKLCAAGTSRQAWKSMPSAGYWVMQMPKDFKAAASPA